MSYFSLTLMIANESLGFRLLVGKNKQNKDITLGSGKIMSIFQFCDIL